MNWYMILFFFGIANITFYGYAAENNQLEKMNRFEVSQSINDLRDILEELSGKEEVDNETKDRLREQIKALQEKEECILEQTEEALQERGEGLSPLRREITEEVSSKNKKKKEYEKKQVKPQQTALLRTLLTKSKIGLEEQSDLMQFNLGRIDGEVIKKGD